MTFTEQIAERILSCNPTDTLGLSLVDYIRLISGDLILPPKRLEDIAERLGVSFAWLTGGERIMIKACKDCPYIVDDDECKLDGRWAISDEQYNKQKPMWCPLEKKEQTTWHLLFNS